MRSRLAPVVTRPIIRILSPVIGAEEHVLVLGDAPVTLGRGDDNDVVLLEQAASRHHARIEPTADGYELVDCGSAAGLMLGDTRVQRHRLVDGDEVKVGATTLRFVLSPGSEPTILPTEAAPAPSTQSTQLAPETPAAEPQESGPLDLGEAATLPPDAESDGESEDAPVGTMAAAHVPAPAPLPPPPPLELHVPTPAPPPSPGLPRPPAQLDASAPAQPAAPLGAPPSAPAASSESFVMGGGGASSPSAYSIGGAARGPSVPSGGSGGYTIDGSERAAESLGGIDIHGGSAPSFARVQGGSSTGAGLYVVFGLLGALAAFGALVALRGSPW